MKKGICPNHDQHYKVANSKKVQKCAEGQAFNCRYCLAPLEPYTEQESPFAMAIRFFKELNPSVYRYAGLVFSTCFLLISFVWIWFKFYPASGATSTTEVIIDSPDKPVTPTANTVQNENIAPPKTPKPITKDVPKANTPQNRPQVKPPVGLENRIRPQTSAERIIRRTTLTPYIMQGGQKMELDIHGLKNRGKIDKMANSPISVNFGLSKDAFPHSNDIVEFTLKNSMGNIIYGPKQIAVINGTETVNIPAHIIASNSTEIYRAALHYQQEELGHCEFRTTK